METVKVRCRIHHWSTQITEKLPHVPEHYKTPKEPLFPEDAEILNSMPSKHVIKSSPNLS